MHEYTHGGLFEGIGVFSLAAHLAGMRTEWQVENDPACQAVLQKHFPQAARYGDVRECRNLPYVDVITAGFPCQPFSQAGDQLGENDPRYLVPEMLRIIDETKPRVCVFENVANFTRIAGGNTYRSFLQALTEMGFDTEWGSFWARDAGAAHARERWFCVAVSDANGRRRAQQDTCIGRVSEFDAHCSAVGNAAFAGEETAKQQRQPYGTFAPSAGGSNTLEHTSPKRRTKLLASTVASKKGRLDGRDRPSRRQRIPQPRLGGSAYGFACGLDGIGLPVAAPNAKQYPYEPPRTVPQSSKAEKARIAQLGNAIYAPVAIEILAAVKAYLDEITQR